MEGTCRWCDIKIDEGVECYKHWELNRRIAAEPVLSLKMLTVAVENEQTRMSAEMLRLEDQIRKNPPQMEGTKIFPLVKGTAE